MIIRYSRRMSVLKDEGLGTKSQTVDLTKAGYSDWAVTDMITISNPSSVDVELLGVTDSVSGIDAVVTCPSMIIPADGSLTCTCSATLPDARRHCTDRRDRTVWTRPP